jgi:hypothetical protein
MNRLRPSQSQRRSCNRGPEGYASIDFRQVSGMNGWLQAGDIAEDPSFQVGELGLTVLAIGAVWMLLRWFASAMSSLSDASCQSRKFLPELRRACRGLYQFAAFSVSLLDRLRDARRHGPSAQVRTSP